MAAAAEHRADIAAAYLRRRADGYLARTVLLFADSDVQDAALYSSCKTGKIYEMTSRCDRPAAIAPSAFSVTGQERSLDD